VVAAIQVCAVKRRVADTAAEARLLMADPKMLGAA
jgi:hypothetical protein